MDTNQNQVLSTDSSRTTTPDQALKMITDLWGVMIALFGVRWSSQFGETPDASGQWRQTLSGISRQQVADALGEVRTSGRAWPPTAPEFREMCLSAGKEKQVPMEAAYAELTRFICSGRRDYSHVSPILYHTISRNMDLYNYKLLEEWKALKMFEVAYKATLFQIECGEELRRPPPPETLIEKKPEPIVARSPDFDSPIKDLLKLFDGPDEPAPITIDEMIEQRRLERVKNDV